MKFGYQAEKFDAARRSLMLPHPNGEEESIQDALMNCGLAISGLDRSSLNDEVETEVRRIEAIMKADGLSTADRSRLSTSVDYLASWFNARSLGVW